MCESGISIRGYMQIYQDTRVDLIITSITGDQNSKCAFFFLGSGSVQGTRKQNRGGRWFLAYKSLVVQRPRSLGEARNRKRTTRGSRWCAHRSQKRCGGGRILEEMAPADGMRAARPPSHGGAPGAAWRQDLAAKLPLGEGDASGGRSLLRRLYTTLNRSSEARRRHSVSANGAALCEAG
jgi:hypothetical protein